MPSIIFNTTNIIHMTRRVWRYQRVNQNPYIEEEQTTQWLKEEGQTTQWLKEEGQTTQWPKEKEQKDKQRSTKHTHKTKDRVTRTPLISWGGLRWCVTKV